jgi:protein arginine kinase
MSTNGHETTAALDRMLEEVPQWVRDPGPEGSVILSSRVRLARNLSSVPFPARTDAEQQAAVVNRIRRLADEVDDFQGATFLTLDGLDDNDWTFLVERRLVSRDFARAQRRRGAMVSAGESLAIMVNEEDHFRLQYLLSGLRLGEALDRIGEVDGVLDARLDVAYDSKLGYLTACPTNVGTGMRASVLAHLPALVLTKRVKKVIQGVSAMGMAVRGYYGEGTELMGNFLQISNQVTLGEDEHAIASRLDEVVRQIIGYEQEARDLMWSRARVQLEDKIYRAYATLRQARIIGADEVLGLSSAVRFGIALELGGLCPLPTLNEILVYSQPAHVVRRAGRELDRDARRRLRAEYVRGKLENAERGGEPFQRGRGIG